MSEGVLQPLIVASNRNELHKCGAQPFRFATANNGAAPAPGALARRIAQAIYWSLAANIALLLVKVTAFLVSSSMAVMASAVDSLIDLCSQAVIGWADRSMSRKDARYPAGKARLEPISVLACAFIMTLGALGVVQESGERLAQGIRTGVPPALDVTTLLLCVLGAATLVKAALWRCCVALRRHSGAAEALAEDHLNDVLSMLASVLTAALAAWDPPRLWWADPAGGILVSAVIVWRWGIITHASVAKGPASLTIQEAAAISQDLKDKLEALPEVEAASVVVVPHGTHVSPSQPALLLPDSVSKPPGAAHPAEGLLAGPAAVLAAAVQAAASGDWHAALALPDAQVALGAEGWQPEVAAVEAQAGPSVGAGPSGQWDRPHTPQLGSRRLSVPTDMHRILAMPAEANSTPYGSPRSVRRLAAAATTLAEYVAWRRTLRDRPDRGLCSASFSQRDGLEDAAAAVAVTLHDQRHGSAESWPRHAQQAAPQQHSHAARAQEDAEEGSTDSSSTG